MVRPEVWEGIRFRLTGNPWLLVGWLHRSHQGEGCIPRNEATILGVVSGFQMRFVLSTYGAAIPPSPDGDGPLAEF